MTPTVKWGIAPANFSMTDWESFDVPFGLKADLMFCNGYVRFGPIAEVGHQVFHHLEQSRAAATSLR
jgi:hypothetical protein